MAAQERTLEEIKREILKRVGRTNPFERTKKGDVEEVLGRLAGLEPDLWGLEWGKIAARYEALAADQEQKGRNKEAGESTSIRWRTFISQWSTAIPKRRASSPTAATWGAFPAGATARR